MPELVFALLLGAAVALFVALPLRRSTPASPEADELEPVRLRHRLALDAVRDVEADRRAGSLDEAGYAAQRAQAEAGAVQTLRELEAAEDAPRDATPVSASDGPSGAGRRGAAVAGGVLVAAVAIGFWLPPPIGLANPTVENPALAAAQAAEAARQARITELEQRLAEDARDPEALSALADAYLAGGSAEELVRAAVVLLALIGLEPEDESAYARLITAYIRAGDYANAAAATDGLADVNPESPDVAYFRGLIALRGTGDTAAAVEQFDRFLRLAPDDARAAMVRGLRSEAAGEPSE